MDNIYITKVDLATIDDSLQMGEFELLASYLIILLELLSKGVRIVLQRLPLNDLPVTYGVITNLSEFKMWVEPVINQMGY